MRTDRNRYLEEDDTEEPSPSELAQLRDGLTFDAPELVDELPEVPVAAPVSSKVSAYGAGLDDSALNRAEKRAKESSFRANIGRAGERIGAALGGVSPEFSGYDKLETQGRRGVDDIVKRRALQDQSDHRRALLEKSRQGLREGDPSSPENIAFRGLLKTMRPSFVEKAGPAFEQVTRSTYPLLAKELDAKIQQEMKNTEQQGKARGKTTEDLRTIYVNSPVVKRTQEINEALSRMAEVGKHPSAASDIALVYSFMKVNDPGSTVREGEFATAENSGGTPARLMNLYNKLLNGERLNPAMRSDFMAQAHNLFQGQRKAHDAFAAGIRSMAEHQGVDPTDVIVDYGFGADNSAHSAGPDTVPVVPPGQTEPVPVHRSKLQQALKAGGKVVGE